MGSSWKFTSTGITCQPRAFSVSVSVSVLSNPNSRPSRTQPNRVLSRGRTPPNSGVSAAVDMMHDSTESGVVVAVPASRP